MAEGVSFTTTEAPGTGHTATFTVALTSQPTADVTIALSSSDSGEGTVEPATLTFTSGNWNETQLVTVTGVPDGLVDGDQPYTIVTAATSADPNYDGLDIADVAVTNIDEDTAKLAVALAATVAEGGTLTGTVTRNTPTADALTVNLSSDDTTEATVPATVTIAAGQASATFTLTAVDDGITDGAHDAVITATATAFTAATDTVSVTDVSTGAVDALIRKQGDPAFAGSGVVNTTATGQTATQTAAGNVLKSYDVRVFNRQTDAHALTLKASASAGGGIWTITYFDGASDITAAITSAEGWTTAGTIDPAASTTIRIDVKPAITVEADIVKTVTLTATTAGDAEASDTVAAATTKTGAPPPVLTAAAGDSQVLLEWTPVVGATGYTLSRGPASFGPWTALPDTITTTYLDDTVTNGTTYYYHVTATVAGVVGDDSNVASATPHMVPHPDLSIRLRQPEGEEETYLGTDVFNVTGASQNRNSLTYGGNPLRFEVKLANVGAQTEPYVLKAADATDGWTVKFYDGLEESAVANITSQVTGDGWAVTLPVGAENARHFLICMTPLTTGTVAWTKTLPLTGSPKLAAPTASNTDVVKASGDVQGISKVQYSVDGGDVWTDVGTEPISVIQGSPLSLRASKGNPSLPWPDRLELKPEWKDVANGNSKNVGDQIALVYDDATSGTGTSATNEVRVECGNVIKVEVKVLPFAEVELWAEDDELTASTVSTPAAEVADTQLTALVTDWRGRPLSGVKVRFTTTLGQINNAGTADDEALTNAQGHATVVLKAGTVGTATTSAEVVVAGAAIAGLTAGEKAEAEVEFE